MSSLSFPATALVFRHGGAHGVDTVVSWSGTHLPTLARIGSRRHPRPVLLKLVKVEGANAIAIHPRVDMTLLWFRYRQLGRGFALDAGLDEDVGANRVNKLKGTKARLQKAVIVFFAEVE
ncbi:hypothetical protein C8Q73DRAFT_791577 [Cubamyces lactineus]|nr:hypothetical protein C8Q73DRAFT_791577 [Cubamyces lactineus]